MKKNPLFSILIASYNNEKYIRAAINSALNQNYKNIEIVIVDDYSEDKSELIIKDFIKKYKNIIIYLKNEKNMGCGYTKNRCTMLANGEILGFLDSDDILDRDAVSIMVKAHLKNPQASLIYSRNKYFFNNDLRNAQKLTHQRQVDKNLGLLYDRPYLVDHFATFKKKYYLKTGGINPSLKRAVDQDLYYKMEEVGEIIFVDKYLYFHRIHQNSISIGFNRNKAFSWHIKALLDACERRKIEIEKPLINLLDFEFKDRFNFFLNKKRMNLRYYLKFKKIENQYNELQYHYQQIIKSKSFKLSRILANGYYFLKKFFKIFKF